MSKTILASVDGFTPVIDNVVSDIGVVGALVFGKIWRYCQMEDGVCWASHEKIAESIGVSRRTVWKHAKRLVELGYLEIYKLPGGTNTYKDTGKAQMTISLTATSDYKSQGCELNTHPPVIKSHTKIVVKESIKDTTVSENETEDKPIEEAEMDVEERKKSIERAMLRGMENHNEYSGFPEDVRPILKAFIDETGYNRILQKKGFLIKAVRDLAGVGVSAADIPKIIRIMKNKGLSHPYPSSLFTTALEYVEEKKNKPDRTVKGPRE